MLHSKALLTVLVCAACGCASSPRPLLRFQNREPVWRVADRQPIAKPAWTGLGGNRADVEMFMRAPMLHALSIPEPTLAKNINSLGEVPDSTWFTNRIGARALSAAEVARGPGGPGPDRSAPWTILKRKAGGSAAGFVIADARGDRYIMKLDPIGAPETETAAEAIVARLLWAAGYNVPENHVVHFVRDDLVVAQDAEQKLPFGEKVPLRAADVDASLAGLPLAADGRSWRAMASKYLDGIPVGGFPMAGVRSDDPNDRVAHEHRRDVRGQLVFFAWLGHTDVKQNNTLDMWVPRDEGVDEGVVIHHVLDFGKALGTWARDGTNEHDGYSPHFDYSYTITSLLRFGTWKRPWEGIESPPIRGVGRFEAQHFHPGLYAPASPYPPFFHTDRFDAYWAAKIIARFERQHIEAAVAQGQYSDPRAVPYLVEVLLRRRRRILQYWFARVNPVDHFDVSEQADGVMLCGVDLALHYGVASPRASRHHWEAHDARGAPLGWRAKPARGEGGRLCARAIRLPEHDESYARVVIHTSRRGNALPDVIVHVARDPRTTAPRIVGIERR